MAVAVIIYTLILLLMGVSQYTIYEKAGQPGIASLIPGWNIIVLLKIVKKPWWWIFLFIVPGLNIIFLIWTINLLSKSFGKDEEFTVGLILLPVVFFPILAFGETQYIHVKEERADINFSEVIYNVLVFYFIVSFILCGLYAIFDLFIIK